MDILIKRLDHLGIISGTIKSLGIIKLIDERLKKDAQGEVTQGEAVAAMILNGLGFVNKPLTLTPQFFETKPLDILIREGITEEQLNRYKLGRTLESIADYGCEELFNEIAFLVCKQEKISLEKCHNDTTSFSFQGQYNDQDEDAEVFVNHGYSKAKRPDLKQIILELCASGDGGVPFVMKPWSGNTSDNEIFNERIKALKHSIAESDTGIVHIADSKLYTAKNISELGLKHFVTRVPATINEVTERITQTIKQGIWTKLNDENKLYVFDINHYGVDQRWVVVYSQQANNRAKETMKKMLVRKEKMLNKDLFHLQAQRFACETDARMELKKISKKYNYFTIKDVKVLSIESHSKRGRPTTESTRKVVGYKIMASYSLNQQLFDHEIDQRSCYVLATNIPEKMLSAQSIITDYKGQDCVEKGFAFLKSTSFFAKAFFMKSVRRIQAMLVIMTLSLLIYTVAQRRLRNYMKENHKTFPNQINKQTHRPTLRWIFQCLEGINYVVIDAKNAPEAIINGITDLRRMILSCFGEEVLKIYQIF